MNWDAIGAIGEILGATAVFASLIYLAIQIRTQNRESRLGAMHDVSIGMRDLMSRFGAADMAPIVLKANENFDQLTDEEALRFITLAGQYFLAFEEAFTKIFVHRAYHDRASGRPAVFAVTPILSFAKDIDTKAELQEAIRHLSCDSA